MVYGEESELFRLNNEVAREELPAHVNLLKPEHIKAWTGAWTEEEKAHMEREARRLRFRLENKPSISIPPAKKEPNGSFF